MWAPISGISINSCFSLVDMPILSNPVADSISTMGGQMKLQPQLFNLNNLLNGRIFKIPEYQRAYSWVKKQRDDLFADIMRVKSSNEDHFMATIVGLIRGKKNIFADEFIVVEIVDGQQRITTLVLLLKSIRLSLNDSSKIEKKIAEEIDELLVKGDELSLLILQTNHDTSNIFSDYVRDGVVSDVEAITSADQNIIDAIYECEAFVNKWINEGYSLVDLIGIIRNRLWAIFHSVDDERLVYRVFEVLNSRGLDVSWIDKLKSQLMGLAFEVGPHAGREQAIRELHTIWKDIYRTIGRQKYLTAETVRFAGTLKASAAPSRPLGESAAVQRLVEIAGTKSKQVVDCAKWLCSVVDAEDRLLSNHRWRAVTQILQARLVAIAVLLRKFSKAEQNEILGKWEKVSFRIYGLAGMDARTKVGDYTRLAWSISNESLTAKDIMVRLESLGEQYTISDVIGKFDPSNCYEGWTEQLRYFLYRYEEYLAEKAGQRLNESQWNRIWSNEPSKSVEHIKPQSSSVSYLHHLGNLMMLPPGVNSSLKDKDPKVKAKTYLTCGLLDSNRVALRIKRGGWDKAAVERRSKDMLTWAKNHW